jgi:hypothetical protein
MQIPFVGPAYQARSPSLDAQRTVNLFPVVDQSGGGKTVTALYGTPGLRLLATLPGSGGCRGAHRPSSGNLIVVRGASVYRVASDWTATLCGTLLTDTGVVSIADNGTHAIIADGRYGYSLTLATNAVAQITSDGFYGADAVEYLDGYFILNRPDTNQFYISRPYSLTFDPLDFASAEGTPSPIIRHIVDHRELWFFKRNAVEVWVNSGGADFPFSRTATSMQVGCAAPFSVARLDNSLVWLGSDDSGSLAVYRAQGYQPARVSTEAIDYAISQYADVSDAVAYSYEQEGHSFYVLTFPSANATWCYDAATNQWHERLWRNPLDGSLNRHRTQWHVSAYGQHVVGDWDNGKLYALDMDCYTDNGDILPRIRTSGYIANPDNRWMTFDSLELLMESGVGLQSGQGSNPQALLEWSDSARVWSNKHAASIGKAGQHSARVIWRRLGRSRSRVFRLTITDPVRVAILGATVQMRLG